MFNVQASKSKNTQKRIAILALIAGLQAAIVDKDEVVHYFGLACVPRSSITKIKKF